MRKPLWRSEKIHKAFQEKYRFGDLGLYESVFRMVQVTPDD